MSSVNPCSAHARHWEGDQEYGSRTCENIPAVSSVRWCLRRSKEKVTVVIKHKARDGHSVQAIFEFQCESEVTGTSSVDFDKH